VHCELDLLLLDALFSFRWVKESGIWKHRRRSLAVWTAAVPEDDLITAKALSALTIRQIRWFCQPPAFPAQRSVVVGVPAAYKIYRVDS
jgi:hypothetical protein